MDERFSIDNGIMIAHAGLLAYEAGFWTPLEEHMHAEIQDRSSPCHMAGLILMV